jgi:hypothetical protein
MKQGIGFILITAILLSCHSASDHEMPVKSVTPIEGTWELISGEIIIKDDTAFTDYTRDQKMIKIINGSHFAFLKHDLNKGKDSAIYGSGGGTYTLVDSTYTEQLDYCSDREWEGHSFKFKISISNDTLVQTGIEKLEKLGVDQVIIEKYMRLKEKD